MLRYLTNGLRSTDSDGLTAEPYLLLDRTLDGFISLPSIHSRSSALELSFS